jgi:DNA polymerase-3 subunit epsilon
MKPIAFFDLETTGVDKTKDRIVEIAIVRPDKEFYSLVNPGQQIPESASSVHGITNEMVKGAPTFRQIMPQVISMFEGCDIGGYNSNVFDIPLLYCEIIRAGGHIDLSQYQFIDACNIFKRKEERTLTAAVKFYCNKSHEDAHGALADVKATIDVFNSQQFLYEDIGKMDRDQVALYCNYDKPRADLSGNFTIDAEGDYVLTFGKNKGIKAKNCKDYLNWMLTSDFMPDTKQIIHSIINK